MMRYVVANWKMYEMSMETVREFAAIRSNHKTEVIICPPFPYLPTITLNELVSLGAQNCSEYDNGAYTGEVSAYILNEMKVRYVIIGHSEDDHYFRKIMQQSEIKFPWCNHII